MIIYAMAITQSALQRDESRGAHAKIVLESDYNKMDAELQAGLKKKYGSFHFDKETGRGMTDDGNDDLVFFERNDKQFMRTTVVTFDKEHELPVVSYREFEHSLIKPRLRNYAVAKKE
jgi:succinate dehydrogenase / fumarate reductase flavoprotein subunit